VSAFQGRGGIPKPPWKDEICGLDSEATSSSIAVKKTGAGGWLSPTTPPL